MMAEAQKEKEGLSAGGAEAKDSVGDESEQRRNMMRIALARRMKRDLLISEVCVPPLCHVLPLCLPLDISHTISLDITSVPYLFSSLTL
mmetsp:Transcript_43353/g.55692  ORF Transcript_43353/g.55692 Transcript_43353/m.55692 type:complete len:89 (+) Transcript_43353:314-580(+)